MAAQMVEHLAPTMVVKSVLLRVGLRVHLMVLHWVEWRVVWMAAQTAVSMAVRKDHSKVERKVLKMAAWKVSPMVEKWDFLTAGSRVEPMVMRTAASRVVMKAVLMAASKARQ